jgi:hypothetical protein
MKHWLFRNFPWVAITVTAAAIALTFFLNFEDKVAVLGGVAAGVLGFCYFIQQQRLAETQLFVELFTRFNARYDQLNDSLAGISAGSTLGVGDRQVVVDYLNLCAEEYLFFSQGYILPDVWQSWCRGILQYLKQEPFRSVWREEVTSGSYYGLTDEAIRKGAS